MPSYSVRRQRIKEFRDVCGGATDSIAQSVLESNGWNVQQAINYFFNNRHLYPELKQGNKSKLGKLFNSYADEEDPDTMSEAGQMKFYKDVGISSAESVESLALAWHINASEMGLILRDEFIEQFSKSGCSDKKDVKKVVGQVIRTLNDAKQFKAFYKWLFDHVKEEDNQRTIPTELAGQLWKLVFHRYRKTMTLLSKWLEYCETVQDTTMKAISRDCWEQIYEFLLEVKSLDTFEDNGAWPVAVDEFVEWLSEQN